MNVMVLISEMSEGLEV